MITNLPGSRSFFQIFFVFSKLRVKTYLYHIELSYAILLHAHGQTDTIFLDQHGGGGVDWSITVVGFSLRLLRLRGHEILSSSRTHISIA